LDSLLIKALIGMLEHLVSNSCKPEMLVLSNLTKYTNR
jgi:hypothetical protein